MKAIKKLAVLFVILAVLLGGAGFFATKFISKEFLEKKLSQATGREFKINGELSPQFSLTPSVKVTDVVFGNANWGSRQTMAKIGELEVKLDLVPLLSRKVKVSSIVLKDSDILLENKKGKWNFEFDKQEKVASEKSETEDSAPKKKTQLELDNLEISNSTISINQAGQVTKIKVGELSLSPSGSKSRFSYKGELNNKPLSFQFIAPKINELAESKKFDAEDLRFKFSDYNFSGNANINLTKKTPYISGALSTEELKLAKSSDNTEGAKSDVVNEKKKSSDEIPLDSLKAVNADLNLSIGKLTSGDIVLTNLKAPLKISGGQLNVNQLTADFAEGEIQSVIKMSKAQTNINLVGRGLIMEDILAQTMDMNNFKNGPTDIDLNLTGYGSSVSGIKRSLSGTSKIYMKDGVYTKSLNSGSIAEFAKLLGGGKTSNTTPLNCVLADISWNEGVGSVKTMAIDSKYTYILGKGQIKLRSDKIDMVLTPKAKSAGLVSLAVPVAVKGAFSNPSFFPDPKGAVQSITNNFLGTYLSKKDPALSGLIGGIGGGEQGNPCASGLSEIVQQEEQTTEEKNLENMGNQKVDEIKEKAVKSIDKKLGKKLNLEGLF